MHFDKYMHFKMRSRNEKGMQILKKITNKKKPEIK